MIGWPSDASSLNSLAVVDCFVKSPVERPLRYAHHHLRRGESASLGGCRLVKSCLTGPLHAHSPQSCFGGLVDSDLGVAKVAHILKWASARALVNIVEARCRLGDAPWPIFQGRRRLRSLQGNERILLLYSRSLNSVQIITRSLLDHRVAGALRDVGHAGLLLL